ncbi:MAG: IS630 family transposase, partial [Candidatus Angelobacter sp.]
TVLLWRRRYKQGGLAGIVEDSPRSGRPKRISEAREAAIVEATIKTKPKDATHWSVRAMAASQKVSPGTVQRIWKRHKLQPHRVESFKFSNDPDFAPKVRDIVGLYLNPPDKAIVLSVDEKSQIQALDRTQPGLPFKKGRCGTMTHDYKRNGTTTLFAALDTLQGKVVGECHQRHRHQEFLKFLRRLDMEFPGKVPLHLVMDNYGTHKHEKVRQWLKRNPRFVPHFVPTSSSWLNLVERWFGHLTQKAIRRGVFLSVADLQASIEAFMLAWNQNPKPFVWTATVESIQEKLNRCRQTLEQIQPGCTKPKTRKRRAITV